MKFNRFAVAFIASFFAISCARHRVPVLVESPIPRPEGAVSFKFLVESSPKEKEDAQGWEFQSARLIGDAVLPVYPERALAARLGPVVVIVRIVVSPEGNVTDISSKGGSTINRFSDDLFRAVDTAVRNRKFTPPAWWLLADGSDLNADGKPDFRKVVRINPVTVSGDLEFLFEMKGGHGAVRSTAPSQSK